MFSGQITNPEYAIYLKQQYESYKALENKFDSLGNDSEVQFPDHRIKRAANILKDLIEMDPKEKIYQFYLQHLVIAHIYKIALAIFCMPMYM